MMIQKIIDAIQADGRASDWKVGGSESDQLQWYFVRDSLDQVRQVATGSSSATVWVDSGEGDAKTRGECNFTVQPTASAAEIKALVTRALDTAASIKNPWFPLPEAAAPKAAVPASAFDAMEHGAAMERVRAALFRHDGLGGATVNSLELFLSRVTMRLRTSRGVDAAWTAWEGFSEFVVNAGTRGKDEVELYADIRFADLDEERLAGAVRKQLEAARDRLAAVPTPAVEGIPLLLSGELAAQVYAYWFENAQAAAVYEKRAAFAVGDNVCAAEGQKPDGDPVTMRAVPMVKGSPGGSPYDSHGTALGPVTLYENGVLKGLVASTKYAHYLKAPRTGILSMFELDGGKAGCGELRSGDHLEVVTFSDFFVEEGTGDFGGEIRLAYLVRGGARTPVRGGSVTGNLADNKGRIRLSRELEVTSGAKAPACCLLPAASVTAAE